MITRRTFLSRVAGGVIATAVVAQLPLQFIPESVRRLGAADYLLKEYNRVYRGCKFSEGVPRYAECGRELFDAYEAEISSYSQWCDTEYLRQGQRNLIFKSVALIPVIDGWRVNFTRNITNG